MQDTGSIAYRMSGFLERQIRVVEEMRTALEHFAERLEAQGLSSLADEQARREALLSTLAEEFGMLKKEWDAATDIPGPDRRRVEALFEKLRSDIGRVEPLLTESVRQTGARMATITDSINTLRRGKQVMQAYKSGPRGEGGGLDREG